MQSRADSEPGDLPAELRGEFHEILDRFEAQWWDGPRPEIAQFLPNDERLRPAVLRELVLVELENRCRSGDAPQVDELLAAYPELKSAAGFEESCNGVIGRIRQSLPRPQSPGQSSPEPASPRPDFSPGTDNTVVVSDVNRGSENGLAGLSMPNHIGRYDVERVLGQGAFGVVYLAHDNQLQRLVAIKVPHRKLVDRVEDAEAYLSEARAVASLDHPHIIPVYDVGSTAEFPCFVVSKYIDGTDLASRLKQSRLSTRETVELVVTVAEALHHAHQQGLVHRDIKPGNLMLDKAGKCFLADFGLALREQDVGTGPRYAGTPAYMSPEQARGEGHRVDGRSDIFSLGVVLYELLAGKRPFHGDSAVELLQQVINHEPRSLRQIDAAIPQELDRICSKSLAKRASERYTQAQGLADDLRHFLAQLYVTALSGQSASGLGLAVSAAGVALPGSQLVGVVGVASNSRPDSRTDSTGRNDSRTSAATSATLAPLQQPLQIVPKGLRSFDAHDADFFVDLLPGPRDREGLPESLRFWKTRIEETDSEHTFPVGLIYGPSGCGKSSLMKAGLLPRLSDNLIAVYVESTSAETETRLLNGLRKRCPGLPEKLSLKDALAALRRGRALPVGKKVLVVLDQFEQWLHAHKEESNTELVQALRQCDGEHVQCIVMVRDDFWLAVSRFLRDLEIRLVEGQNSALVDLFDREHARKVLAAFGRAFGKIPADRGDTSKDQQEFLKQAVAGLAQEGKVISVRLALFSEMMKDKTWSPAALKEVGGAAGIGVTFLEETFSAGTAPAEHRYHQQAAREVLKALLPESGTDIKGHMRSYDELLAASGYADRPRDFDDLICILDGDIRLITPTAPEGAGSDESLSKAVPGQKYYQLTHDYLVHSLRDWLNRKQKETRRGRAELRLAELTALWQSRRENRHLPSLWEYLTALSLIPGKKRTEPQREMLRKAGRVHALRWGSAVAVSLAIGLVVSNLVTNERRRSLRGQVVTAVDAVQNNRGLAVPLTLKELDRLPQEPVVAELKSRYADAAPQHKQSLAYALAHYDDVDFEFLVSQIQRAAPDEVDNLAAALAHARETSLAAIDVLAKRAMADKNLTLASRLAIVALQLGDDRLARDLTKIEKRPSNAQRAFFINVFPAWHGNLVKLAESYAATSDPGLRSALCLGIGGITSERLLVDETNAWKPILTEWFQVAPDGGTHSAAEWALRQIGVEPPALPAETHPPHIQLTRGRQWFVNSVGMTLLAIEPGEFVREDSVLEPKDQTVRLTRPFFFADREVSVGQFQAFLNDADYPNEEKALQWPPVDKNVTPTPDYPVKKVTWYETLMFCNWLSRREGRTACYERTGEKEKVKDVDYDAWRLVPGAMGYRLPTEAEWEYACRAGARRDYPVFFRDEEMLRKYAVFQAPRAAPGGRKLPNGWGLFDMLGNAFEWCYDGNGLYPAGDVTDPIGTSWPGDRVIRGGSWYTSGASCDCEMRGSMLAGERHGFRDGDVGFRVVLNASQTDE